MKQNFHVLIDIEDKKLQKEVVQVVSSMCLDSVFVNFNPSPANGPFIEIPCDLFLFSLPENSLLNSTQYRKLHLKTYKDANYIYFGKKFYFYDKSEVLEIPAKSFIKYLTRCLLNHYLEFNKRKITEELKKIKD